MLKLFTVINYSHRWHFASLVQKNKSFYKRSIVFQTWCYNYWKKTDSYPFPSTNSYGAFLFLHVVLISILNQGNPFTCLILNVRAASDISKKAHCFTKKDTWHFTIPLLIMLFEGFTKYKNKIKKIRLFHEREAWSKSQMYILFWFRPASFIGVNFKPLSCL